MPCLHWTVDPGQYLDPNPDSEVGQTYLDLNPDPDPDTNPLLNVDSNSDQ